MSTEATRARLALAKARLKLATVDKGLKNLKDLFNRWPAGTSKGGQFAPKAGGGMGGGNYINPTGGMGGSSSPYYGPMGSPWPGEAGGAPKPPAGPPKGAKPHPHVNDKGEPVTINYPSKASGPDTWHDGSKAATFVPGGDTPEKLNGVPMKSWKPPAGGWNKVTGANDALDDDFPFERPPAGKSVGAGVLIVEPDGRVWLTKPTNEYGGYKNTFPKGTAESGLTMQQNAIKEAFEETGLKIKITGVLGDYDRTTSRARMYIAERVGGTPKDMGWESQAVRLVPVRAAKSLLNMGHDKKILEDLEDLMSFGKAKAGAQPKGGHWQTQPRWPGGSPLGGQWKTMGADGLTMPPTIAGGLFGSNAAYQKAVDTAYKAAVAGDKATVLKAVDKYADKAAAFSSGQKGSSHVKWGAQAHQYLSQLAVDMTAKVSGVSTAEKLSGPVKLSSLGAPVGNKPGGSNPGAIYVMGGEKWLVKGSNAAKTQDAKTIEDRSRNEVLAAKLMQAAGVGAPDMKLVDLEGKHGGGIGVASKMIDGLAAFNPAMPADRHKAIQDFAVHAWLANYDALGMGYDNTMMKDGKAINIDTGGALLFRAQGAKKGASHGVGKDGLLDPTAPEFESMRKTSAEQIKVYGGMTAQGLKQSAEKLLAVSDDTIRKLVTDSGMGDAAFREKLAQNLIDRKNAILAKAGVVAQVPPPGAPPKAAAAPAKPPASSIGMAEPPPPVPGISGHSYKVAYDHWQQAKTNAPHSTLTPNDVLADSPKVLSSEGKSVLRLMNAAIKEGNGNALTNHFATAWNIVSSPDFEKVINHAYNGMLALNASQHQAAVAGGTIATDAMTMAPRGKSAGGVLPTFNPAQSAAQQVTDAVLLHGGSAGQHVVKNATTSNTGLIGLYNAVKGEAAVLDSFNSAHKLGGVKMMLNSLEAELASHNIKPSDATVGPLATALGHSINQLKQVVATKEAALKEAAKATPPQSIKPPEAPVFAGSKFASADKFYNSLAQTIKTTLDNAEKGVITHDGAAAVLKAFNTQGKYPGGVQWKEGTANGTKIAAYYNGVIAYLEGKAAATTMGTAKAADAEISKPVVPAPEPGKSAPQSMGAMPDFKKAYIAPTNVNAPSVNGKIDTIAALAAKGDVKGLLSLGYGTNNYAKSKHVALANAALAALGSPHAVAPGQKKGTHPALFGGKTAEGVAMASGVTNTPPPPMHPVAAKAAPKVDASLLPGKPTFITSNVAVKQENEGHATVLQKLAERGDLTGLKAYDKFSQQSQKLTAYKQALIESLETQLFPPRPKSGVHKAPPIKAASTPLAALADHAKHFPAVKVTEAYKVASHHKVAAYVMLGKTDANAVKAVFKDGWSGEPLPASLVKKHSAIAQGATEEQKSAIRKYVSNWAYGANDQMRNKGAISEEIRRVSKAMHELAQELPAGTVLKRMMSLDGAGLKALQAAQPGDIIQSPQFESAANPTGHYGNGKNVMLKLITAPGVRGIYVGKSLGLGGEDEMMMPENTRYAIHRVYKDGHKTIVEAVVLPTTKGSLE